MGKVIVLQMIVVDHRRQSWVALLFASLRNLHSIFWYHKASSEGMKLSDQILLCGVFSVGMCLLMQPRATAIAYNVEKSLGLPRPTP